ncbi:unnamed protein product [Cladocopium goreaui]|uniref:tRNA (Cytosine(38)-C(5))-methyltransferase (DN A (Cytosine-5)-methyltransferase-like protein 2) (Dnmt2) (M.SpomI) (SpIM.SpoI) n=1 Tax=Cladocopium goreaui TaxID=2562237 RepID=A0A9P1FSL0_9DINO|nr:unnamed protein product [Cladocopium goreaui]
MADAFVDRPNVWRAISGSANPASFRHELLLQLFERNLWLQKDSGCSRVILQDGKILCCFMFVPPGTPDISFWQMLQAGILKLLLIFGPSAFRRLLQAKAVEEGEINVEGAYRLERMVVEPSVQGKGIGTRALQLALAESDAAGHPVLLKTNEERNVTFYQRLGFEAAGSCGSVALGKRRRACKRLACHLTRRHARGHETVIYEFFSGIGGLRLAYNAAIKSGSDDTGARFRAYEVDEVCCHVYGDLYGASKVLAARREEPWKNAEQEEDELWRCSIDKLPDAAFDGADLWLMSPPCQPFTRTGHRRDVADPRCRALLRLVEALPCLKAPPKGLLLENVVGFQHSEAHRRLRFALEQSGYEVFETVLDPRNFGFPNTRRRFYLLAKRIKRSNGLLSGAHSDHGCPDGPPAVPPQRVDHFLKEAHDLRMRNALQVPKALLEKAFVEGWQLDLAVGSSLVTKTFTGSYGKLAYGAEGLSMAGPLLLDAEGKAPRTRFAFPKPEQWKHVRYFSPKEMANLMGFPDDWSLPGRLKCRTQWRLVGNSVNVAVVEEVLHVDNADNYLRYAAKRQKIRKDLENKALSGTEILPPASSAPASGKSPHIKTHEISLKGLVFHPEEPIDFDLQESWLWHGTRKEGVEGITSSDFDIKRAGSAAGTMFGRGLYFAESCMKSDEYTVADERGWYPLILCRVTCGRFFYCDWKRPFDHTDQLEDACHHKGFHCVLGDREKVSGTYREYIVFDNDQVERVAVSLKGT